MTVNELYKSVAELGFETSLESNNGFLYAANRALLQIASARPATRSYIINHSMPENLASDSGIIHKGNDEIIISASGGKAYYFEVYGNGYFFAEYYSDGTWKSCNDAPFSTKGFEAFQGFFKDGNAKFVDGEVRIRFSGNFAYTIKNTAIYSTIYSDNGDDIPAFDKYIKYDISALTSDFYGLLTPPITYDGVTLNQDYNVEDERIILLPYDKKGIYKVHYKHKPSEIQKIDTTKIDLEDELASLLPLVIAAYVWADDEPEKANYYLQLFRERLADIERRETSVKPVRFNDAYGGWV